jgi:S-adenosylmethionine-dependent methyltransferase
MAPGGRLSVIAPNPAHRVIQRLVRSGPAAALEALASGTWTSATFAHEGRLVWPDDVEPAMEAAGLAVVGRHGGRIANDLLTDDAAKLDPGYFADLERLELALCDAEPYKRLGAFWQLVAEK